MSWSVCRAAVLVFHLVPLRVCRVSLCRIKAKQDQFESRSCNLEFCSIRRGTPPVCLNFSAIKSQLRFLYGGGEGNQGSPYLPLVNQKVPSEVFVWDVDDGKIVRSEYIGGLCGHTVPCMCLTKNFALRGEHASAFNAQLFMFAEFELEWPNKRY